MVGLWLIRRQARLLTQGKMEKEKKMAKVEQMEREARQEPKGGIRMADPRQEAMVLQTAPMETQMGLTTQTEAGTCPCSKGL